MCTERGVELPDGGVISLPYIVELSGRVRRITVYLTGGCLNSPTLYNGPVE